MLGINIIFEDNEQNNCEAKQCFNVVTQSVFPSVSIRCWYQMFVKPIREDIPGDHVLYSRMIIGSVWNSLFKEVRTQDLPIIANFTLTHARWVSTAQTVTMSSVSLIPVGAFSSAIGSVLPWQQGQNSDVSPMVTSANLSMIFPTALWSADASLPQIFKNAMPTFS